MRRPVYFFGIRMQQNHSKSVSKIVISLIHCFPITLSMNRGSNMSAHDLLNLLNEVGQRDKMRGLPSIFSFSKRVK